MTVIVAIFDSESDMDRAIDKLSELGLGATVLESSDESQRTFRTQLADFRVPAAAIDRYLVHFAHGGKFLLIRVPKEKAEEIMKLLRANDATQLNCHG